MEYVVERCQKRGKARQNIQFSQPFSDLSNQIIIKIPVNFLLSPDYVPVTALSVFYELIHLNQDFSILALLAFWTR